MHLSRAQNIKYLMQILCPLRGVASLLQCGLHTVKSFQRSQHAKGVKNCNCTVETPDRHHLRQVVKGNVSSEEVHPDAGDGNSTVLLASSSPTIWPQSWGKHPTNPTWDRGHQGRGREKCHNQGRLRRGDHHLSYGSWIGSKKTIRILGEN